MTTLYVAGPMTGLPDFNYPAFFEASEKLRAAGYDVENPADNRLPEDRRDEPMWLSFMRLSLVQISRSDGIALLPGWEDSDGAHIEHTIGVRLFGARNVRLLPGWLPVGDPS